MIDGRLAKQKISLLENINTIDWGSIKEASLCLTITGQLEGDLLTVKNGNDQTVIRVYSGISEVTGILLLVAEIRLDAKEKSLVLSIPWSIIKDVNHLLLIRYNGARLELWVDGVLIDEEWPMGSLPLSQLKVQAEAGVLEAAIWNYALTDAEIKNFFAQYNAEDKKCEYLGNEPRSMQYSKPRGFNTSVGDCMPFYDGKNFHIYYLFDRRGHRSKWGLGAHQWAHISTKNFIDWEYHPMAIEITGDWEGSICTGSVIKANDKYYGYYAVRAVDGSPARLTWAEGLDGVHFEKTEIYLELSDNYNLASIRDPHVFKDQDGLYRMLITTSIKQGKKEHGCLAQLVSRDLKNWVEEQPFIVPGYHDQPECSDYFEWNGWYYLIFSNDGNARYRYSRNPLGPWLRPAADLIDGIQLRVPKSAGYMDGRRMAVGFLSTPDRYGGELIIRELIQHVDGTLSTKFLDELIDRTGPLLNLLFDETSISLDNVSGYNERVVGHTGEEYMLSFEIKPQYVNMYYGFSIADSEDFKSGFDIRFEPSARKVGIHAINSVSYREDEVSSIYNVNGLSEAVVKVEAIVKKGFIDLCINGSRTFISRLSQRHTYLRFFSQFGAVTFSEVKIQAFSE